MSDHIHIFIDVPQTVVPYDVARTLKSISAIKLFKVYYSLKSSMQDVELYGQEGILSRL